MPLQNRVTPFGDIIACPERGSFMGNRGILHDEQRQLTERRWTSSLWITCRLEYKGCKRALMTPGKYTELFFLDEATALAAGHRPCAECRREDYLRFRACWQTGNPQIAVKTISDIDRQLHHERLAPARQKRTYSAPLDTLPDGAFIALDAFAYLVWGDELLRWSPGGYQQRVRRFHNVEVTVLTPPSIVNALIAGYVPQINNVG